MTLAGTEEHVQLADSVRAWAERLSPPESVRAAASSADHGAARYGEVLAPALAEQGLLGLHVPESEGGQGFGLPELAVAIEQLGAALLPGAFVPTTLASAVLTASGAGRKLVAGLADGTRSAAIVLSGPLRATAAPDGALTISGTADAVLSAGSADLVVVPATVAGTTR